MSLLENPAKTSLAVLSNMAAGPAGVNLADLRPVINKLLHCKNPSLITLN